MVCVPPSMLPFGGLQIAETPPTSSNMFLQPTEGSEARIKLVSLLPLQCMANVNMPFAGWNGGTDNLHLDDRQYSSGSGQAEGLRG